MKHKTIRNHKDFYTPRDGIRMRSVCFYLKIKDRCVPNETRYGLVAAKKIFKTAVERNRAKRVMRAWLTEYEDLMTLDQDYIFILNPTILNYPRNLGFRDTRKAIKRIAKAYNDEKTKQISE